jgi:hypothetical protein
MDFNTGRIAPIVALVASILILIMPMFLNYIVAFYLSISAVGATMFGNAHEGISYSCKNCGNVQTYMIETRR